LTLFGPVRILCLTMLSAVALMTGATPSSFPGAEGFGAQTPGGRGGKVLFVRNLNDSGPGSFREAVNAKGARTVLFRVGGLITLKSPVNVTEPFLTIAGQTAPGDGICIRGSEVSIRTHDVIVRYVRFRPGDISEGEVDALDIMENSHDVIVDHCSATWSIDEDLSPSGAIHDVTVQWSLIAEGLNNSTHHKGPHGYGSLVRAAGGLTLHHNLWAHNTERSPRLGDNYGKPPYPVFDVRNNVMYDYGLTCSGWTGDHLKANYVANYIRPGPSSTTQQNIIALLNTADVTYYVHGNVVDDHPQWTVNNALLFTGQRPPSPARFTLVDEPFETPSVRTTTAEEALWDVLEQVGATLPHRDSVDARIIKEVNEHSGSVIDSQWEVGGWPEYRSARPPIDSDSDGIPDDWERAHGLNPHDPSDALAVDPKTGYTNLEIYLNELARQ
jgi:pectate lyase